MFIITYLFLFILLKIFYFSVPLFNQRQGPPDGPPPFRGNGPPGFRGGGGDQHQRGGGPPFRGPPPSCSPGGNAGGGIMDRDGSGGPGPGFHPFMPPPEDDFERKGGSHPGRDMPGGFPPDNFGPPMQPQGRPDDFDEFPMHPGDFDMMGGGGGGGEGGGRGGGRGRGRGRGPRGPQGPPHGVDFDPRGPPPGDKFFPGPPGMHGPDGPNGPGGPGPGFGPGGPMMGPRGPMMGRGHGPGKHQFFILFRNLFLLIILVKSCKLLFFFFFERISLSLKSFNKPVNSN